MHFQVLQCLSKHAEIIYVLEYLEVLIELGPSISYPIEEILGGADALTEHSVTVSPVLSHYSHQFTGFLIDFNLMESARCIEARKKACFGIYVAHHL